MPTKCYAQVRGSVIRATLLDGCGVPDPGASATVISKRVSTVTIDEVTEDGTNVRERNFADELCVVDDAFTQTLGYTADIALCGVDPGLVTLLTGQPTVENAAGDIVGFDATTDVDLDGFGFALEVWSRIAGTACEPGQARPWGYTVFPFLKGGRIGGFSFQNGMVQFTIAGAQTRDGNGWGVGPYDVDMSAGTAPNFTAGPLFEPLGANTHYRNILVTMPPPAPTCGTVALAA